MKISVQIRDGPQCFVSVWESDPVDLVKHRALWGLNICPSEDHWLLLNGKVLQDGMVINEYKIKEGDKLFLLAKPITESNNQNENVDWNEVVDCVTKSVEKILDEKKDIFEQKQSELMNQIKLVKSMIVDKEMTIEHEERRKKARMDQFSEEEDSLKSQLKNRLENLFDEKKQFEQECQMVSFDAVDARDVLLEEMNSLISKKYNMKESFKRISHAEEETKKVLQRLIQQKEKDLMCPVCLEESVPPIFSCQDQHIICSDCMERVLNKDNLCPVCREDYGQKRRRHRFAEDGWAELKNWRKELKLLE